MSPVRAILLHSPGRKPWVNCFHTFIEPHRGGTFPTNANPRMQIHKPNARCECRSYGALNFCAPYLPRVSYRALPSFHPGLCRSVALKGSFAKTPEAM